MADQKPGQFFSGNTNSFNVSHSYNGAGTYRKDGKTPWPTPFPPGFPFGAAGGGFDPNKLINHLEGVFGRGAIGNQVPAMTQNIVNGVIVPGGGLSRAVESEWKMNVGIGQGTFGAVFLEQVEVSRHGVTEYELWAVKRIPKGVQSFPAEQYKKEIALLGALKQNELFVKFIKSTEDEHHVYIAMEYLPLGDMSKSFADYKWGENDVHVVMEQLLMGVAIMHEKGIAHRDLKPENVFLWLPDPDQPALRVKIGDFGTSKRIPVNNNATFLHTTAGTISYMAPEVDGDDMQPAYTQGVDVWSLGCIMFRAVTGHVPFGGRRDVWQYSMGGQFPPAGVENIGLSRDAIGFLAALLQPDPKSRPSAGECLKLPWITNKPSSPHFLIGADLHKRLRTRQIADLAKLDAEIKGETSN